MNAILKTASIVTSGFIVGAIVRKYAHLSDKIDKKSFANAAKELNKFLNKDKKTEDIDKYFI